MSTAIYGLFYLDRGEIGRKRYFYVGRSVDVFRRLKQHQYAKKDGHEDKYEFIREIEERGIEWNIEVLKDIPEGEYPPDNERWYVISLIREGHELKNMRYGSEEKLKEIAEQVNSAKIRSIADVESDRINRKYQKSKKVGRRVLLSALRSEGVPDVPSDKLLPRALHRKLVQQGVGSIEAGVTLSEIYRICRGERKLRDLRKSLPDFPVTKKNG
ncbi:hypothetical protein [uncultured Alcanivorax sp.]|uniref:hypothetical protein n=1 Tax=uncultured Alcanivorax sp. TaxID=191215 RepID=UPI002611F91D|nr:hypothetical protein [uncultured Alcanivorax sp.]